MTHGSCQSIFQAIERTWLSWLTQIRTASKIQQVVRRILKNITIYDLVGGIPTPLKNMRASVGIIIPNIWKNNPAMFQNHLNLMIILYKFYTLHPCPEPPWARGPSMGLHGQIHRKVALHQHAEATQEALHRDHGVWHLATDYHLVMT